MTRFSRHLALAAWAILGLAGCGGDSPNEPTPNPGAQTPTVTRRRAGRRDHARRHHRHRHRHQLRRRGDRDDWRHRRDGRRRAGRDQPDRPHAAARERPGRRRGHGRRPQRHAPRTAFMFEAPSASTNQPPIIGGITSRSTRAKAPSALRRPRRHAHRHRHGLRRGDAGRSAALRVDRGRRRVLRHRPRGHVAGARAGHHAGRGAPEPRRRRDLPDGERPGPAGHGGTPRAGRVHGAAARVGQGSARPGGRVPGRLLAAAALARAGRPQLHRHVPRQGVRARGRPRATSRSSRSPATASSRTRRSRSPSASSAAIATASATPAPTSRCAGNRPRKSDGRRVVSFGDRPGERRLREQPLAPVRQRLPRHHHRERRADAASGSRSSGRIARSKVQMSIERSDRVRYRVVAFAVALAGVTYLDRICISTLAPSIMRDLALTKLEMSYVFSAFAVAYAAVRGAVRVVGRARRHAARADAHRLLVVHLHHRDGVGLELQQHARDPVPLRGRRGGRVAERREDVLALDPRSRARARPGRLLRRRLPRRRPDAGPRAACSSRGSAGAASSSASAWSASSGRPPGTAGSATSRPSTRPSAPPSSP